VQGSDSQSSLPLEPHKSEPNQRRWAGVYVTSGCRRMAAAVVATRGNSHVAQPEIIAHRELDLPAEIGTLHTQLQSADTHPPSAELGVLRSQLAEHSAALVREVLADARAGPTDVLAIGVHDPGLWNVDKSAIRSCLSLCDAARLASATGMNVVDAFAQRDLAEAGHGGPVLAMPTWSLLHDPQATRVLVDLGRSIRLVYLPPAIHGVSGVQDVLAFDSGPGMHLIDRLTSQFSEGRNQYDPGGRLAVQGCKIPSLIEHWLEDRYFKIPPPRWHPLGVECEEALQATVRMAVDSNWSIRDLLCTGTHFIAESIRRAIDSFIPKMPAIDELILTGGGQLNGLLLREIATRFPDVQLRPLRDLGVADNALDAASVALLAQFYVDQLPATSPNISGVQTPRILGRLTPGDPVIWQRLIREMAAEQPAMMSLRNAV
jgi:anhydro-N-acetylmuramic acid kinase